MATRRLPKLNDELLTRVCEMFLAGNKAGEIADWLNRVRDGGVRDRRVTREQIYALIDEARKRKIFSIRAPVKITLAQRLADVFGLDRDSITVVGAESETALDHVASRAAELTLDLIKTLTAKKETVHVGLGAGNSTLRVAQHLAVLLRAEEAPLSIVFHALSAGFRVENPRTAPVAFFGLFENLGIDTSFVGLFAPSIVKRRGYSGVLNSPVVAKSFKAKHEIDIVVTALASANDDHCELNVFLGEYSEPDIEFLKREGWVGDVQYRPYSNTGPIVKDTSIRAVTLFELPEFVKLASTEDKHVIALCGPCSQCKQRRTDALRPLLTEPALKVWSHLVLDAGTARELLPRNRSTRSL